MRNRIITISREFGSGGRTIGKLVAEKLGIPCYDRELIEKFAERSGFSKEFIKEKGEYADYRTRLINVLSERDAIHGLSMQDHLWQIQRNVILELAEKEPCVIVGRCADHILDKQHDLLKVFIHADMEKRKERILKLYGKTDEAEEKRLKDKDKRRAAYYRFYTDAEWGDIRNCHIALDSGIIGIEKCAEIIAKLY